MKIQHWFFFILKLIIIIQYLLIILHKETVDSKVYLVTDITFKISLSLYIEYLLFFGYVQGLDFEDKIIMGFASGLLSFDAIAVSLPKLLKEFHIIK
jgi:hypothetical protein